MGGRGIEGKGKKVKGDMMDYWGRETPVGSTKCPRFLVLKPNKGQAKGVKVSV